MHGTLSIHAAIAIGQICSAAGRCAPVARVIDTGNVVYGQARSVGDEHGNFLARSDDVRDGFLRVTTSSGWEVFWPMGELIGEWESGEFVLDYKAVAVPTGMVTAGSDSLPGLDVPIQP